MQRTCVQVFRPTSQAETDVETESDTGSLPDRLMNPEEYEPLLPTTKEHTAAEHTENEEPVNEDHKGLIDFSVHIWFHELDVCELPNNKINYINAL